MRTLTIKDLPVTEALDAKALASVRGGMHRHHYPVRMLGLGDTSKHHFSLDVEQLNAQTQLVGSSNGVNVAFAEKIRTDIKPSQTASNSVSF